MNKKEANFRLKNIIDKFGEHFKEIAEKSRIDLIQSSSGGAMIPLAGRIYGNEYKASFEESCKEYQAEATQIMDEIISSTLAELTRAPSDEAVNIVQMLRLREELNSDEVYSLLAVYGKNAQAYKAITSVAAAKGVRVTPCPIDKELKELEEFKKQILDTLTLSGAERGHATESFLSFFKSMSIDTVLPVEK